MDYRKPLLQCKCVNSCVLKLERRPSGFEILHLRSDATPEVGVERARLQHGGHQRQVFRHQQVEHPGVGQQVVAVDELQKDTGEGRLNTGAATSQCQMGVCCHASGCQPLVREIKGCKGFELPTIWSLDNPLDFLGYQLSSPECSRPIAPWQPSEPPASASSHG